MRPLTLVVSALASAALACTSSVGAPPQGFSMAYEPPTTADGGAPPALHSVEGGGPGNAWAVGESGTAVRLAGYTWTPVDSGSTAALGGLSMLAAVHPLAVELGGARVLAFDGRAWSPLGADRADRAAAATFGVALNDAWVAGNGIEHWDGTSWTQEVPSGATYSSLFGSFQTDVWAVGPGGIQHYDGQAWSAKTSPAGSMALNAVWVSELWDGWIVGAQGTVLHWDGRTLSLVPTGTTKDLTCVTGTAADDVWVGGQDGLLLHFDGTGWSQIVTPAGRTINDVWRAFGAEVYLVDDTGAVTRYVP